MYTILPFCLSWNVSGLSHWMVLFYKINDGYSLFAIQLPMICRILTYREALWRVDSLTYLLLSKRLQSISSVVFPTTSAPL